MDEEAGTGVVVVTEYTPEAKRVLFQRELALLINRFSWENGSEKARQMKEAMSDYDQVVSLQRIQAQESVSVLSASESES